MYFGVSSMRTRNVLTDLRYTRGATRSTRTNLTQDIIIATFEATKMYKKYIHHLEIQAL